jgi:hypothetical protein
MPFTIGQGGNGVIMSNDQSVTSNTTLTSGTNWASLGPITINSGVTLTVNSGAIWTLL